LSESSKSTVSEPHTHPKVHPVLIALLLATPYVAMGQIVIFFGRVWGDEGWYLMATHRVVQGYRPYADYLFTQMPLLPYVYAPFLACFGERVIVARVLSFLFGGAALGVFFRCAYKRGGLHGLVVSGMLLALDRSVIFDVCLFRTQALTLLWTAMVVLNLPERGAPVWRGALCLFAAMLCVLTRLSLLPVLPFVWGWLLLDRERRRSYFLLSLASIGCLAGVYFFFSSGGRMLFGIYRFHSEFYGNPKLEWKEVRVFFTGFWNNQSAIIVLWLACAIWGFIKWVRRPRYDGEALLCGFATVLYAVTTTIHVTRPVGYPCYQTSNLLFAMVLIAVAMGKWFARMTSKSRNFAYGGAFLLVLCGIPFQQCVLNMHGEGTPKRVEYVNQEVAKYCSPGDSVIAYAGELVVETGLELVPGYEMSEFSNFAWFPDKEAAYYRVLNSNRIRSDIENRRAKVMLLRPRDFSFLSWNIGESELMDIIRKNYDVRAKIPYYGQFLEDMIILTAKPAAQKD
jgi:hypothetical protein